MAPWSGGDALFMIDSSESVPGKGDEKGNEDQFLGTTACLQARSEMATGYNTSRGEESTKKGWTALITGIQSSGCVQVTGWA
jgi:hypothetical protein